MLLSVGLVLLKHKQTANRSKALPGAITCSYRTRNVVLYIILTLFLKAYTSCCIRPAVLCFKKNSTMLFV